jgi:hypothetical protein
MVREQFIELLEAAQKRKPTPEQRALNMPPT